MPAARLVGLDVARCLALLGMVATHVLDARDPDGSLSLAQAMAGGRASALFAVLAGVTLALGTGRQEPVRGQERVARSSGIAVRALLIAVVGLYVGGLDTGLAIILVHYALLFLLGLAFVGLRAPALAVLALAWVLVMPVVSHLVRPTLPPRGYGNPSYADLDGLESLGRTVSELLLTGYYPVLPWLGYLLAGMALGRLDLGRRDVATRVAVSGAALAVLAYSASRLATARPDVREALLDTQGAPGAATGSFEVLMGSISGGMYGTTPTDGPWQWLLVVAPHSGTPFDLAHTIGCAMAVVGVALLAVGLLGAVPRRAVAVIFGAGAMTLSLYTLHAVMRTPGVPPEETPGSFVVHVLTLLFLGAAFAAAGRRGPLEWLVSRASRTGSGLVRAL